MGAAHGMHGGGAGTTADGDITARASVTPAYVAPAEHASRNGRLDVTLTAADGMVPYNGGERWAMTYNGDITGPTIRVRPGDRLRITLINDLQEPTSLHTHGLHVNPDGDGDNPFLTIAPGERHTYVYDIPRSQQPGTFWYHPHAHGLVAKQVNLGLEGAIIVDGPVDAELAKATTERILVVTDPPLVTQDPWPVDGHSANVDMMTAMMGRSGERLLTNGADGVQVVPTGALERVRLVNATASTQLRFTWTGARMLALASEGGRLSKPQAMTSIVLTAGERTEVVLVPGADGGQLVAQRVSQEGTGAVEERRTLIADVVAGASTDTRVLPATLGADDRDLFAADVKIAKRRTIRLTGHMQPLIDGRPFDANTVNVQARRGTIEEWTIVSESPMDHPIHLHVWPFQVRGQAGWHDIVQVPAGTTQVIRVAFEDIAGTTVIHCHILDHEDTGMMAVIKVS